MDFKFFYSTYKILFKKQQIKRSKEVLLIQLIWYIIVDLEVK